AVFQDLSTVITTETGINEFSEPSFFSEEFLVFSQSDSPLTKNTTKDTDSNGRTAASLEQAWGSVALLSGYFHGKSLLKKPATAEQCETAMEKYGNRLLYRRYNISRRNQ
ncbi:MAG: hypothetical protein KDA77_17765, partial [Planctomycetaceae bacterium]|nr:hypothetical protein [Planctomycetaceae bacterium]